MLKALELIGFKSFAKKSPLSFQGRVVAVVGPNGSGKSNVVEAIRFVLGEQSMKSMRGKSGADLIFKGSKTLPKQNRAVVKIIFDNKQKRFQIPSVGSTINLDFDEVSITREVELDGSNRYSVNGTEVRLKDIMEMLSSVNIGTSGHHIISQGEADRILNASMKERRAMVEDALGLKIYQYRIRDSLRKLERASDNMKEVELLRKEIVPHLNFLKKQVEKIEKAKEMRVELGALYDEYLKREEFYLETGKAKISPWREELGLKLEAVNHELEGLKSPEVKENKVHLQLLEKEREISELRMKKDELSRKLGRLEGILELKESKAKLSGKCPVCGGVIIKREEDEKELADLRENKDKISAELEELARLEIELLAKIEELKKEAEAERNFVREGDVKRLELTMEKNKILADLNLFKIEEDRLGHIEQDFLNEIKEGSVLVGSQIINYKKYELTEPAESGREIQEERRRKIERIKIRLEDAGLTGGPEILKEYEETTARDQFLAKEIDDLEKSIASLEVLISDLKMKLETDFREGIEKINKEFQQFFELMFGGGTALLEVIVEEKRQREKVEPSGDSRFDLEEPTEDEDEAGEKEYGIDINVTLPHKKVKELHALSGGERSLASIALLFAMSQVNPPPFLVLDETDAALDEANSRKYGNMLEKLSAFSQLIVVTHNRETMSRASILYGITIGQDGASKLLSIKFDEAVTIAK